MHLKEQTKFCNFKIFRSFFLWFLKKCLWIINSWHNFSFGKLATKNVNVLWSWWCSISVLCGKLIKNIFRRTKYNFSQWRIKIFWPRIIKTSLKKKKIFSSIIYILSVAKCMSRIYFKISLIKYLFFLIKLQMNKKKKPEEHTQHQRCSANSHSTNGRH